MTRFDTRQAAFDALTRDTERRLREDVEARGKASLVVSGGRTPVPWFDRLSVLPLPWKQITVTLADERWVPHDHPDSNSGLVRRHLLTGNAFRAPFVDLYVPETPPEQAVREVSGRLAMVPRPFSVVQLGMGNDGHFASIFPEIPNGASLLDPHGSAVCAAVEPLDAPHDRMTLTLSAIRDAGLIALLITGEDKLAALEAAREADTACAPPIATLLRECDVHIYWAP